MSTRSMIALKAARALVATAVFAGMSVGAQARCSSPADQAAFDVGALKSELSVLAVACSNEENYNSFVERDRGELVRADGVVNAWFKKTYGRAAQPRYDSYITLLANEQGLKGQHEGSDFCPRMKPIFAEAAVVPLPQLAQFAAVKDLLPKDMACVIETGAEGSGRSAPARHESHPFSSHRKK